MALREFVGSDGVQWTVWEVTPTMHTFVERRRGERRTRIPLDYEGPERRAGRGDRRSGDSKPLSWLAFESKLGRRRLLPAPAGWEAADPAQLDEWCRTARPVVSTLEWQNRLDI